MAKFICSVCKKVFEAESAGPCPGCGHGHPHVYGFNASDDYLRREVPRVLEERERSGLAGLVGGLECVIINTEPEHMKSATGELLLYTGLTPMEAFEDGMHRTCVLRTEGSADFLVRARLGGENPFAPFNSHPKAVHLPNTRLETFVFDVKDINRYVEIQKARGVKFLTDDIVLGDHYAFIQTAPSRHTGNSTGVIQWTGERGNYATSGCRGLGWNLTKPGLPHLGNIGRLDHTATRIEAGDRDAAIVEFMELTNYDFDFAMVFTSGIHGFTGDDSAGPTERFIHNYGTRVHHMAFQTERIDQAYEALVADGEGFLIELVGSEEEGLKQTFSEPSQHTLLVNEYIHRYGGFDGFFTRSNVTLLTGATGKQ